MILYVAFYSSGMGNTAWLSSEFFPMEVRALGAMMVRLTLHLDISMSLTTYS